MSEIPKQVGDFTPDGYEITKDLIGAAIDIDGNPVYNHRVSFHYTPDDPYAVRLTHHVKSGGVSWIFAIHLLEEGLSARVGIGDVAVRPVENEGRSEVTIEYWSNAGHFSCSYARSDLEAFLTAVNERYSMEIRDKMLENVFELGVRQLLPES